jgi:hypothetical protein
VTDRLEHYALPVLPALSLLVAGALAKTGESRSIRWAFRGLAILGVLVFAVGIVATIWIAAGSGFEHAAAGPSDRLSEADFSILADMPDSIARDLLRPAAVTVAVMAIGFMAALWFETRRRRMHAVLCVALVMMAVCGMIHWSFAICEDLISSKRFAVAIARAAQPRDRLVVVDDYETANSLSFYQPLHVEVFDGLAYALVPGMKYPDAPKIVLTREEFSAAWQSERRVFALVPKARIGELNPPGIQMMQVLHRVLVRNR